VSVALRELQGAIEELNVAIEQLNELSDGLGVARNSAHQTTRRYDELFDALPIPSVFTDEAGLITSANEAAAELLNLSARHLAGKPMVLFVADRDFFMKLTREANSGEPQSANLTIRPRDRKTRLVECVVQHLPAHSERCWFLMPRPDVAPPDPPVS
jgi:PAS domain S-box-containing protein